MSFDSKQKLTLLNLFADIKNDIPITEDNKQFLLNVFKKYVSVVYSYYYAAYCSGWDESIEQWVTEIKFLSEEAANLYIKPIEKIQSLIESSSMPAYNDMAGVSVFRTEEVDDTLPTSNFTWEQLENLLKIVYERRKRSLSIAPPTPLQQFKTLIVKNHVKKLKKLQCVWNLCKTFV